MKLKKSILIAVIMCISLLLGISALAFWFQSEPSLRMESAAGSVDLHIAGAEIGDNTIALHVNYDSYGPYIEFVTPLLVAADRDFTQPLVFLGSAWSAEENQFVYIFEFDDQTFGFNGRTASSIYVRPPVIHVPVEFEAVSVPVVLNATMPIATNASAEAGSNKPWFSISSIEVSKVSNYEFLVSVMIEPYTLDFPRLPRLVIDGISHDVLVTHHSFDVNAVFTWAAFEFPVRANDAAEIYYMLETAYIAVDSAMYRTHATDSVNAATALTSGAATSNSININFVVD